MDKPFDEFTAAFERQPGRFESEVDEHLEVSGDPQAAYSNLLLHGLVVEEQGLAVSVVCGISSGEDPQPEAEEVIPATRFLALETR